MQPSLAPAPPPPHQHISGPGAQVEPSYSKEENVQILIDGWEDSPQDTAEAEQALRAHLLHNIAASSPPKPVTQSTSDQAGTTSSHDENINIDPAISGVGVSHPPPQPMVNMPPQHAPIPQQHPHQHSHQAPPAQNIPMGSTTPEIGSQGSPEVEQQQPQPETPKRGGKRELSTSKRAAQNRAAQRAFRQRKEGYIKKLEEQVRDLANLEESYKAIQNENYQLRDYIISLQSRLIESQGEDAVPPAPILITHQQPSQPALPSHLLSQQATATTVMPHGNPPQVQQTVQHAQPQTVPTAPMGMPMSVPPPAQMVPQATMVPVQQSPQQPKQQQAKQPAQPQPQSTQAQQQVQPQQIPQQQQQAQQQAQQQSIENGIAAAKRALDEEAGFNSYVAKKLRGEAIEPPPAAAPAPATAPTSATPVKDGVNGKT